MESVSKHGTHFRKFPTFTKNSPFKHVQITNINREKLKRINYEKLEVALKKKAEALVEPVPPESFATWWITKGCIKKQPFTEQNKLQPNLLPFFAQYIREENGDSVFRVVYTSSLTPSFVSYTSPIAPNLNMATTELPLSAVDASLHTRFESLKSKSEKRLYPIEPTPDEYAMVYDTQVVMEAELSYYMITFDEHCGKILTYGKECEKYLKEREEPYLLPEEVPEEISMHDPIVREYVESYEEHLKSCDSVWLQRLHDDEVYHEAGKGIIKEN